MEEVELRHCWIWDCPECGRENLDRGFVMNEEERQSILKEYDLPQHTILRHGRVACKFCDRVFDVALDETEI